MYYSDKPISQAEEDLLRRRPFAKILAQSLLNLRTSDTFSIGLFGKWGSGKTSIVNMMLYELEVLQKDIKEDEQILVVHFEPWNFTDSNQLLSQFFIRLSNEFKSNKDKNLSSIADALDSYSDAFGIFEAFPVVGTTLSSAGKVGAKVAANVLNKGDDRKDIQKQKEYVIKLLRQQKQRILVVIDDIDRLSNEQIRQIFQLIASVGKFPNTMYLLVFDKDIVVQALAEVQTGDGEDYLEKIIQMPIQIPDIKEDRIRQVLFSKLNSIISEYDSVVFQPERWQSIFEDCIEPYIDTLRDINRLCNSVQFKLTALSSEVDFIDMVAISALEIALPQIYEWIKRNKALLTGGFHISTVSDWNKSQSELYAKYFSQIQSVLLGDSKKAEQAIASLSLLFPKFGDAIGKCHVAYDMNILMRNNRIGHPGKIDRYFYLDLEDTELRKADILKAVNTFDRWEFGEYLLELDANGNSYEFLREVKAMIPEISSERAEVLIYALFDKSADLDAVNTNLLNMRASSYAEHMILDLFDIIDTKERPRLFTDVLERANCSSLPVIANVINMLELAYGRLAANGQERGYNKFIPLDELLQGEKVFVEKAKSILDDESLFALSEWRIVCYLLECFDSDYIRAYLANAFEDKKNIVYYLEASISEWIGGSIEYEVREDYKKYLTEEQVEQAIESLAASGELFSLPLHILNKCGAFIVNKSGKMNYHDNVTQNDVDALLSSWQTKNAK